MEGYSQPLGLLDEVSLGDHCRHILEFYQCLLEGESNKVNYDERIRSTSLAQDKAYALCLIKEFQQRIEQCDLDQIIFLSQTLEGESFKIESNLKRELLYTLEHSIHHLAIMKIAIQQCFPEIKLMNHFGVAYSTIDYVEAHT